MSLDLEKALIGIALSGVDVDGFISLVQPSDFQQPSHEHIWRAINRVHDAGNKPDPASVRLALGASGDVRIDPMQLIDLLTTAPIAGQGDWYATQVAEAAGRRRIATAGNQIRAMAESESLPLAEAREMARQAIDEATASGQSKATVRLSDVLPQLVDIAENGETPALSTGWPDVDRVITGLAPGRLVVVGARPGVGKSVMGTNLALHFAHHHKHAVLVASLEMPRIEVAQRIMAAHARVNLTALSTGTVAEGQWEAIRRLYDEVDRMPITIDDAAVQTVTSIRAAARDIRRQRDDLALIVVDYLQLLRAGDGRANRAEQIGEISRGLKVLARETGACVVAMAQVNREGTKHSDGKPRMTDLRESGAIEADADQVILLHRVSDDTPEIEVIVDKNRWGPRGVATLHIQGHYARLASATWHPAGAIA